MLKSLAVGLSDIEEAELKNLQQQSDDCDKEELFVDRFAFAKRLISSNRTLQEQRRNNVYTKVIGQLQFSE